MNGRRHLKYLMILAISLALAISAATPTTSASDVVTVDVYSQVYQIIDTDEGQRIEMEEFGYLTVPGKPMLPAKNFLIALPPGARVQSVEVEGIGATQLPGTYRIAAAPPILPLVDARQFSELVEKMQKEWRLNKNFAYSSDQAYPEERGKLAASGTLRKYPYASVSFYPFSHNPQSGRLIHYEAARIIINYDLPSPGSAEALAVEASKWDNSADERASRLCVTYSEVRDLYEPPGSRPSTISQTPDYVIITTSALQSAIVASGSLRALS